MSLNAHDLLVLSRSDIARLMKYSDYVEAVEEAFLAVARGSRLEVFLEGKSVIRATDSTFGSAGRVALWTKADSITCFGDLRIQTN